MKIVSFGLSEKGQDHTFNQDRILHDDRRKLYAVADGVSVPSGGSEAAERTIKYFKKYFKKDLVSAIETANKKLIQDRNQFPEIGHTTLTAVTVSDKVKVASVGDSPAYLIQDENAVPLNKLDKFFGTNALSQAIGEDQISVNYAEYEIKISDVILLATDGITDVVRPFELLKIVSHNGNIKQIAAEIIELARQKEIVYKDDKSIIVLKISSGR